VRFALRISELEAQLAEIVKDRDNYKAIAAEGRQAGRAEAVAIFLEQEAESFPDADEYTHRQSLPSGDYTCSWNAKAVRKLFDVSEDGTDVLTSRLDFVDGMYWELQGDRMDLESAQQRNTQNLQQAYEERDAALARASEAELAANNLVAVRRSVEEELDALRKRVENHALAMECTPAAALSKIADAIKAPLQCGHGLDCWDEDREMCVWCALSSAEEQKDQLRHDLDVAANTVEAFFEGDDRLAAARFSGISGFGRWLECVKLNNQGERDPSIRYMLPDGRMTIANMEHVINLYLSKLANNDPVDGYRARYGR
jgi:hypothetical protein